MVRQSGDPDGRPVVYVHGTPSSRLEPAFADAAASELGVRLVCLDRPGLPNATLHLLPEDGHLVLIGHVRDIASLVDPDL